MCDINRNEGGSIHVLGQSTGILSWTEVLALNDPHEVIRIVEAAAGLRAPERTPPSGRSALTFRVISRFLDALLHERHPWDARNAFLDASGWESTRQSLARFPFAEAAATPHEDDLLGEPYYRFWILTRNGEARAVIDTGANLYLSDRVLDLSERYALARRSLSRLTGEVVDLVASDG
ncbi:hypothetical protein [Terracoccus sp. 273MFTsu3.1]|uniref:TY-Chap2 family putative peptide chaperone n=1 Tax=Terracoccus sp. 273MFTsu3.1 TaxID=1172188 RepID=UPI0012DDF260|nr:hypothetical protein [Terracoccus sp. 273MFTsu3.1]